MAKFYYEAKRGPKELITGTVEAESQEAVVEKLNQMGYVPIRIKPADKGSFKIKLTQKAPQKRGTVSGLFKKVRAREVTILTEQLASLVKSRVPLLEAMGVLVEQTENAQLKDVLSNIRKEIRDGRTLSQSLKKYPQIFPPLYINMIESGEAGGVLEQTLSRLSEFRNREEDLRAKVTSALAYPVFIILVGIATVFILLTFVIPRMASLFGDFGQALPLPTKLLLSVSSQIKRYWYLLLALIAIAIIMFKRSGVREKEKEALDRFKLKLPLLGEFLKKTALARFCRTFGLLLGSGIPVFQAVRITIPTLDNEVFKLELEAVRKNIVSGMSLEQSIKKSTWFPRFMANMLAVGEKGGNLEEALLEVASFYEREVDKMTKILTSLLEPAIILIMGLLVGFIVFAMLLPIFQINIGMG
ncbi:MAG: type II secretion system F family protein [Candidatus Omnitrophota bacterium]|nr:MAG: type II secretion system F family protein [Candidatus Omnitrophota bacterium]